MKVIGGSKMVDLSKKLTVEMTLGEFALLAAVLGNTNDASERSAIESVTVIDEKYKSDVKQVDGDSLYVEMASMLKYEGVAE